MTIFIFILFLFEISMISFSQFFQIVDSTDRWKSGTNHWLIFIIWYEMRAFSQGMIFTVNQQSFIDWPFELRVILHTLFYGNFFNAEVSQYRRNFQEIRWIFDFKYLVFTSDSELYENVSSSAFCATEITDVHHLWIVTDWWQRYDAIDDIHNMTAIHWTTDKIVFKSIESHKFKALVFRSANSR